MSSHTLIIFFNWLNTFEWKIHKFYITVLIYFIFHILSLHLYQKKNSCFQNFYLNKNIFALFEKTKHVQPAEHARGDWSATQYNDVVRLENPSIQYIHIWISSAVHSYRNENFTFPAIWILKMGYVKWNFPTCFTNLAIIIRNHCFEFTKAYEELKFFFKLKI